MSLEGQGIYNNYIYHLIYKKIYASIVWVIYNI
jgi:hypothetical protein